jgi:hypothetical protein
VKRPQHWSRPLPQPLHIPGVMIVVTLADVRELSKHSIADELNVSGNSGACLASGVRFVNEAVH